MQVTIYHNIDPDASMGLNQVLDANAERYRRDANEHERHALVKVFEYDVTAYDTGDTGHTRALLNQAFETFNVGDDPEFNGRMTPEQRELARAYRARRLRSLSVGDVVQIGAMGYAVASLGWEPFDLTELNVIDGPEAEATIRRRYQFKPGEMLTVTVPLP